MIFQCQTLSLLLSHTQTHHNCTNTQARTSTYTSLSQKKKFQYFRRKLIHKLSYLPMGIKLSCQQYYVLCYGPTYIISILSAIKKKHVDLYCVYPALLGGQVPDAYVSNPTYIFLSNHVIDRSPYLCHE
jgi:hypothetical protein